MKLLTISDLRSLPPPSWLIDDLIVQGSLVVLYGRPKSGKSFIALDWALSIACAQRWFGNGTTRGNAVYICGEGRGGLVNRVDAWLGQHNIPVSYADTFFYILPQAFPVNQPKARGVFLGLINDLRPALVVIDTLARCFGGADENQTAEMNAFVDGCAEIQGIANETTVVVVHHCGKNERMGMRGSSALEGAADTIFLVSSRRSHRGQIEMMAQKDAELLEKPIGFELASVGKSCVPVPAEMVKTKKEEVDLALVSEVSRLKLGGLTERQIGSTLGISRSKVRRLVQEIPEP